MAPSAAPDSALQSGSVAPSAAPDSASFLFSASFFSALQSAPHACTAQHRKMNKPRRKKYTLIKKRNVAADGTVKTIPIIDRDWNRARKGLHRYIRIKQRAAASRQKQKDTAAPTRSIGTQSEFDLTEKHKGAKIDGKANADRDHHRRACTRQKKMLQELPDEERAIALAQIVAYEALQLQTLGPPSTRPSTDRNRQAKKNYVQQNVSVCNSTIIAAVGNSTVGTAADVFAEEWLQADVGVDPFFMQTTMAQQAWDQDSIALDLGALDPIDFSWEGF